MFKVSMAGQGNLPRDTGYIACGFRGPSFVYTLRLQHVYLLKMLTIFYCNWVSTGWQSSVYLYIK